MELLLVSPKMEKPNGGIAVWTNIYLESLTDSDISVSLLNTAPIGKRASNGSAKRSLTDEIRRTSSIFKELKKLLKKKRFDVVHLNTSCGSFGVIRDYLTAKRIKKAQPHAKIALHYHCDIPMQIHNSIAKKYLSKLVGLSDLNLVLCENSRRYLEREFGAESFKVPNFVGSDIISDSEKNISDSIRSAFFVGRVSAAKGFREIYELASLNPDITFNLAGAVSAEASAAEKPENVKLLGPMAHDDVIRAMDESDVFIFPTHTEGFSLALAEAMARGLPSITTDVGANADMIEDEGGIICRVGDVEEMNKAFITLADANVRRDMSRWCIEKVDTLYRTDKVIASFIEYYEKLLEVYHDTIYLG